MVWFGRTDELPENYKWSPESCQAGDPNLVTLSPKNQELGFASQSN